MLDIFNFFMYRSSFIPVLYVGSIILNQAEFRLVTALQVYQLKHNSHVGYLPCHNFWISMTLYCLALCTTSGEIRIPTERHFVNESVRMREVTMMYDDVSSYPLLLHESGISKVPIFSSAWLCQQSSWNRNSYVVRRMSYVVRPWHRLSLKLLHGLLSNFNCGFPWAICPDVFFNFFFLFFRIFFLFR